MTDGPLKIGVSRRADRAVIPLDVAARWLEWLDGGQPDRVRADLVGLLTVARGSPLTPADPPSSAERPISTR